MVKKIVPFLVFASFCLALNLFSQNSASATLLQGSTLQTFSQNNIIFYDPCNDVGSNSVGCWGGEEVTWEDLDGLSVGDAVKLMAGTYGELTMSLQKEYGVPWELVFMQMVVESSAGTNPSGVAAGIRKKDGLYNLLGMKASNDDRYRNVDHVYSSNTGTYAEYDTISSMIISYTISYLRNGNNGYNNGLQHWGYKNFDLWGGIMAMLNSYCPESDGCNHASYRKIAESALKHVQEVAKEKGWPSSEELAKQGQIDVGGNWSNLKDIRQEAWDKYGAAGLECKNSSATVSAEDLLSYAKEIGKYVTNSHFIYGDAQTNPAVNDSEKKISDDRFVGWVLYKLGYDDQPKEGLTIDGTLEKQLDTWNFQKITGQNDLKSGDIVFVNSKKHVFILGDKSGDKWSRYDVSSQSSIDKNPGLYSVEDILDFSVAYRLPLGSGFSIDVNDPLDPINKKTTRASKTTEASFDDKGLLVNLDSASIEYDLAETWWKNGSKIDPSSFNNDTGEYLDYKTNDGNKPQFIILHSTEGASKNDSNKYCINQGLNYVCAPTFTVDLFEKKIYQHYPIDHPSAAVASTSSSNTGVATGDWDKWSVQIEVRGCSQKDTIDNKKYCKNGEYSVKNIDSDGWGILAELLVAISDKTGVPLESTTNWDSDSSDYHLSADAIKAYHGILSHGNIQSNKSDAGQYLWEKVQEALGMLSNGDSCSSSGVPQNFSEAVLAYAWPEYHDKPYLDMMPAWKEIVDGSLNGTNNYYVGGDKYPGIDCNGFVSTLVVSSGLDPSYNTKETWRTTGPQLEYLKSSESGWSIIKEPGSRADTSTLQPGDVALKDGHTFIYVGEISGFDSLWASASLDGRAPMASSSREDGDGTTDFYIFRKD